MWNIDSEKTRGLEEEAARSSFQVLHLCSLTSINWEMFYSFLS